MSSSPITLIFLIANVAFSIFAFSNHDIFNRFKFNIGAMLHGKEWHRMITSGFLHVDPSHLMVNMLSLFFIGPTLEGIFAKYALFGNGGPLPYIILYFGALLGGNALALLIHRKELYYSAVGASGAISGLLFAMAVLVPEEWILIFFILPCPIWVFAILYVAYSLFGIRTGHGNIGHSAHLGGALLGMFITAGFFPTAAMYNWIYLVLLLVPTILILVAIILNPAGAQNPKELLTKFFKGGAFKSKPKFKPTGLEINMAAQRQHEIDQILDKVARKGEASLTDEERKRLQDLSKGRHSSDR